MRNYQKLVEEVFGEQKDVIPESEFVAALPHILGTNWGYKPSAWPAKRLAKLLVLRYGLAGERPHNLREIGEIHDRTKERIRSLIKRSLRLLSHRTRAALWLS